MVDGQHSGLRTVDALGVGIDCLIRDGDGHVYLQYLNHKMKRTAFVPVDGALPTRVDVQRGAVLT